MPFNFKRITRSALVLIFAGFASNALAQDGTIYPMDNPDEPNAIELGTGGVENQPAQESWFRQWGDPMARNITTATLTPFLPDPEKATGAAVLVAPGGGYRWLSLSNEGWKVAQALADQGIAAFVLKYRLFPTPASIEEFKESMNRTFAAAAEDSDASQSTERPSRPSWSLSNQLRSEERRVGKECRA